MRTTAEAAAELKRQDENTAITPYSLRQKVLNGEIPCVCVGRKRLIDLDQLPYHLTGKPERIDCNG